MQKDNYSLCCRGGVTASFKSLAQFSFQGSLCSDALGQDVCALEIGPLSALDKPVSFFGLCSTSQKQRACHHVGIITTGSVRDQRDCTHCALHRRCQHCALARHHVDGNP